MWCGEGGGEERVECVCDAYFKAEHMNTHLRDEFLW